MVRTAITGNRILVTRFGRAEVLERARITLPPPPPGHTRLRVLAAGVGRTDLMARSGDYLLQRRTPFSPGYDLVAEVIDQGTPRHGGAVLETGSRVAASLPRMGAYTEYTTVPTEFLVPLPDGLDPVTAAALPLDFLTALSLLETHARLARGATVLIQGASGGVGRAVSQLGRHAGLRMYGTASAPGSEEVLTENGVAFVDHRRQDFTDAVRQSEPGGVDAVLDHIGGANIRRGYGLLAPGGVLVSYAFAERAGRMVADTVRGAAHVTLLGLIPGRRTSLCMLPREIRSDSARYRRDLARVLDMARSGRIRARLGRTYPLGEAAEAHRSMERGEHAGKIVLTTD